MSVIIIMGVSGSGKTSVGQRLAQAINCPFYEGDDFHPPENVTKMSQGIPLDDRDRWPWLDALAMLIEEHVLRREQVVVSCSALKRTYRERLAGSHSEVQFVYLQGSYDVIWERMVSRPGHFMPPSLLQTQFDTLEEPTPEEALTIPITQSVDEIVAEIIQKLHLA